MFASLTTSRLIKQKEKPTKKVVVLVSRRNGVEQIKYCQMGKRPTDNQLMGRYAVEEWLDKNLEYVQHIEKHLAVKKKKQMQPKCAKNDKSGGNEIDSEEYQETSSEFQTCPEDLECAVVGTAQDSLEMFSNFEEPVGNPSRSVEISQSANSEEMSENFIQELNNCKQMTAKLLEENNELKKVMVKKQSAELVEEYNKLGNLIKNLETDWKQLRNSLTLQQTDSEEMPQLVQDLQSLKLNAGSSGTEKDDQLQNDETASHEIEIIHRDQFCRDFIHSEDQQHKNRDDTKHLLAKVSQLEKELEYERTQNENNRAVIDFLKKKFSIKTEDLENIVQMNRNFDIVNDNSRNLQLLK